MHDQSFKNLILDYPLQALAFFAAEEVGDDLAQARIVPLRQEQLMERLGERFRALDVPLLVEWPDGRREGILFVIEEETETSRFSIHRLAHYCLDLAELLDTDRVVPVVIFLRPGRRRKVLRLGGDRHDYLEFRYLACELFRLEAAAHLDSDNLVVRLNLPNMAHSPEARLEVYAAAQAGLVHLEPDPEKQSKYADFIDYYADLSDDELARYRATYLNERGELMRLAQTLRQEGRQEGWQEGRQEGWQEGRQEEAARLLKRQLTRRFGTLPEEVVGKIDAADLPTLEAWLDRVLDAESLAAVFQEG
ncbi:MAG TPA: DUF4351 domain-containing protein [Methylococcus sp.]|nr:DUF4351 domain-containing protein [Methylococcus sp.]